MREGGGGREGGGREVGSEGRGQGDDGGREGKRDGEYMITTDYIPQNRSVICATCSY